MTEEDRNRLQGQAREFSETKALLAKVRDALAAKVFLTPLSAKEQREDLYLRVQTLDAMTAEMDRIIQAAADEQKLAEYAAEIAKGGTPKAD